MSVLEAVLLYVVTPIVALLVIATATMFRPASRGSRWRSGDAWEHAPLWWMANPRGSEVAEPTVDAEAPGAPTRHTARGGARGTW